MNSCTEMWEVVSLSWAVDNPDKVRILGSDRRMSIGRAATWSSTACLLPTVLDRDGSEAISSVGSDPRTWQRRKEFYFGTFVKSAQLVLCPASRAHLAALGS